MDVFHSFSGNIFLFMFLPLIIFSMLSFIIYHFLPLIIFIYHIFRSSFPSANYLSFIYYCFSDYRGFLVIFLLLKFLFISHILFASYSFFLSSFHSSLLYLLSSLPLIFFFSIFFITYLIHYISSSLSLLHLLLHPVFPETVLKAWKEESGG